MGERSRWQRGDVYRQLAGRRQHCPLYVRGECQTGERVVASGRDLTAASRRQLAGSTGLGVLGGPSLRWKGSGADLIILFITKGKMPGAGLINYQHFVETHILMMNRCAIRKINIRGLVVRPLFIIGFSFPLEAKGIH